MNILFISFDADPPNMGGTATVVNILAKYFVSKGHEVFLGYINESATPSTFFQHKIFINKSNESEARNFFIHNRIDIVYNVCGQDIDWDFYNRVRGNTKEIVAYHGRPRIRSWAIESLLSLFYTAKDPFRKLHKLLWILVSHITNYFHRQKEKNQFINMYQYADKILLLSMNYLPVYQKILPFLALESNKFVAIHNPLVFEEKFSMLNYNQKEKRVLVVSNISYAKRVELMLSIWSKIEQDSAFDDWCFDFVGDSIVLDKYKAKSESLGIQRLTFYGKQKPLEYYRRSSVFLMTSRFEGWPMVLMESMQMGVVPIVYNSFEALEEIVDDGLNGFIVDNNKEEIFVEKLKRLLSDDEMRCNMANNAIRSCERFSLEIIGKEYEELFLSLCNE